MNHLTEGELSMLLNLAIASSKIQRLDTPYRNNLRPQIHIIIHGRKGSGKSAIVREVGESEHKNSIVGLTKANLAGSVDKTTAELIYPVIWDARNSTLLIDEYYTHPKDFAGIEALNLLLSLMENPHITKKIGYRCNETELFDENDPELFCRVKKSIIDCKSRFVLILNTMMDIRRCKINSVQALVTRCICIPHSPEIDTLKGIAQGKKFFKYKQFKPKKHTKISKKNYTKILTFLDKNKVHPEKYLRLLGDLCRTFAIIGYDEKTFNLIVSLA